MITSKLPSDWKELQREAARILRECGFKVAVEKRITTVRGNVTIDVFAQDSSHSPMLTYLCECKHWKRAVPQTIVHAFRTVVSDYGANCGLLITTDKFQSGARKAARKSNVHLVTWEGFQEAFQTRWIENYLIPKLRSEFDPFDEYTEKINSRIFRKARRLSTEGQQRFRKLCQKYHAFRMWTALARGLYIETITPTYQLPVGDKWNSSARVSEDLTNASGYRELGEAMVRNVRRAIAEFDAVFGERA